MQVCTVHTHPMVLMVIFPCKPRLVRCLHDFLKAFSKFYLLDALPDADQQKHIARPSFFCINYDSRRGKGVISFCVDTATPVLSS